MNKKIAKQFAKLFIARSDVKAAQRSSGEYNPTVERDAAGNVTKSYGFTMSDLLDHIECRRTYGHYLLNTESQCKFFAFDIDLDEQNRDPDKAHKPLWLPHERNEEGEFACFTVDRDPRKVWLDRSAKIERAYLKFQMRMMANELARTIVTEFDIPTAVTYTGAKGIHVYGFTGLLSAKDVREGAELILKKTDKYDPYLGSNFFKYKEQWSNNDDMDGKLLYEMSNHCFTVEVFPKQVEVKEGGYGNLMRLPLGTNLKNPADPTFFVDMRTALTELRPRDAYEALTISNQWA